MSFSNSTTDKIDLQAFLNEKTGNLQKRVVDKENLLPRMRDCLDDVHWKRMNECGKMIATNTDDEIIKINCCKNRLCPVCNRRHAAQKWHKVLNIVNTIKTVTNVEYAMLTLTVRNVNADDLNETITNLMKSIDRLHKTTLWKNNVLGFFRSLEITYNEKRNDYHPHYHYIIALPHGYGDNVIPTWEWRQTWERSARLNYVSQIDIRMIYDQNDMSAGVAEVAKYAVKISSIVNQKSDVIKPLLTAIKGRRLISFGGIIKTYAKQYDKHQKRNIADKKQTDYYHTEMLWEWKDIERGFEKIL